MYVWWMNLEYDMCLLSPICSLEICVRQIFLIIHMSKVEIGDMDSCDHLLVIGVIIFQETLLAGHLGFFFYI